MSQENLEIVRQNIEAFQDGRFDSVVELWDAEGEWIPAMAGAVDDRVYRGHAALRRYFEEFFASFSEVRLHDVAFRNVGERVLVLYRLSVRGRNSEVTVGQPGGTVYELSGGKIVRGRSYLSEAEALKAVGLVE